MLPDPRDRPCERARGDASSQVYHALEREASGGTFEPAGSACDGRDFNNRRDIGLTRGSALTGEDREDAVAIGRDEPNCPDAYGRCYVDLNLESHRKPAKVRGISRCAQAPKKGREFDNVDLMSCQGTLEWDLFFR